MTQFYWDVIVAAVYLIPFFYSELYLNLLQLIPIVVLWIKKDKVQN